MVGLLSVVRSLATGINQHSRLIQFHQNRFGLTNIDIVNLCWMSCFDCSSGQCKNKTGECDEKLFQNFHGVAFPGIDRGCQHANGFALDECEERQAITDQNVRQ